MYGKGYSLIGNNTIHPRKGDKMGYKLGVLEDAIPNFLCTHKLEALGPHGLASNVVNKL